MSMLAGGRSFRKEPADTIVNTIELADGGLFL
jgi:hypothetical protein